MRTDTRDMVSITEATRSFGRLAGEVSAGRTLVVLKNNEPAVAIVPISLMDRVGRLDELEDDLRMLSIALARTLTDDGTRHDLDDVAAEFGIILDPVE